MATTKKTTTKTTDVREAEANGVEFVTFTVNLRGQDVELAAYADILDAPFEVLEAYEQNRVASFTSGMLDETSNKVIRSMKVSLRELAEVIVPAIQEAIEMDAEK